MAQAHPLSEESMPINDGRSFMARSCEFFAQRIGYWDVLGMGIRKFQNGAEHEKNSCSTNVVLQRVQMADSQGVDDHRGCRQWEQ